tara:strand:+ start:125 stop:697 length:573 start_codon:yes stop_codon:yes gene_type:complete
LKNKTVKVNNFVRRQIKGSGKSYALGFSFEEMALHAEKRLNVSGKHIIPGYREGVCLVRAHKKYSKYFFCPLVKITSSTKLSSVVVKRRDNENHYIQIRALNGTPVDAFHVDFILYRHDVLAENNEQTTDADWELISFNVLPKDLDSMPMGPVTMMRNQLELPGGTAAHYSSNEWAESINFWQQYAFLKC